MDTSERYIKMCDCPEIQDGLIWQAWDYCHCEIENKVVVLSGYETDAGCYGHEVPSYGYDGDDNIIGTWKENNGCEGEGNHIWLPRQDQLQEMFGGWPLELLDKFYTFCMWDEQFEELRDKMTPISMEQLWLSFVMKELYQKVWDEAKGEWVK